VVVRWAVVIVGKHELDVEGVGEKGEDSAPALSDMWGKKHDRRGLEVVMNICEKGGMMREKDGASRPQGLKLQGQLGIFSLGVWVC